MLQLRSQPAIRADRRRETMPETLLRRNDVGPPLMQLTAPGRARLAVNDKLANRISELDLPAKSMKLMVSNTGYAKKLQ